MTGMTRREHQAHRKVLRNMERQRDKWGKEFLERLMSRPFRLRVAVAIGIVMVPIFRRFTRRAQA